MTCLLQWSHHCTSTSTVQSFRDEDFPYLDLLTPMEVDIVLPAVPRLVLVGEPGVEGDRLLQVGALHPDSRLGDSEI